MLALCERCSPLAGSSVPTELSGDPLEVDEGAMIVVQPWRGPGDIEPNQPAILINGHPIAGAFHAV